MHAAGFFADDLLSHHFVGAVDSFDIYDAYQSIYPKAFVNFAEGCVTRMADGQGKIVCVSNPGCNHMQTPRVGYDMPGQGKATMEFVVRMYARRLAERKICVNAVSPGYTDTKVGVAVVGVVVVGVVVVVAVVVARLYRHQGSPLHVHVHVTC